MISTFRAYIAFAIATAAGAGLFPRAPGTMGTLVGIPLAYWSSQWEWPARVLFWVGVVALGSWAAKVFDEDMKSSDNQRIVIDEVIGMAIAAWTAFASSWTLVTAFVLFRFFDILKPFPVRQIDRWSKRKASEKSSTLSSWWGGFGVIADDIGAGFQALVVILLLQRFHILP